MFTRKSLTSIAMMSLLGGSTTNVMAVEAALLSVPANPFAGRSRESINGVNKCDANRSKYTPRFCSGKQQQERYARQQAKIAARRAVT
jgi:hypothetical protein